MKRILLVNWDNYPNTPFGGIYAWEKSLIEKMSNYEFVVINLLSNPNSNGNYTVPRHVTKVIDVPLFGCSRFEEFYKENSHMLLSKIFRTREHIIIEDFLPLYKDLIHSILSDECDYNQLSKTILRCHKFLLKYDTKKCIEHPYVWDAFVEQINGDFLYRRIALKEALIIFQIIQRVVQILSIEVPEIDLIHTSLAWFPAMIALFAKFENNCPVIITEHGLAFRDLSLYHSSYLRSRSSNILWKFFSSNIIRTIYYVADVITPVCYANAKWEENIGANPSKIKVIYNGIDTNKYRPLEVEKSEVTDASRKTIVYIGRIELLKDIKNLIEAINYVKESIPDIQCLIYGISTDLEYSIGCLDMIEDLELNENIRFMGNTTEPEKAYNIADIVVLSSISEGFPHSVVEAMACKKAVVSTDVGGIREALEGCGLLVRSRHPRALANAIVNLLNDKSLRIELGAAALRRVNHMFTIEQSVNQYREQYEKLMKLYEKHIPTNRH